MNMNAQGNRVQFYHLLAKTLVFIIVHLEHHLVHGLLKISYRFSSPNDITITVLVLELATTNSHHSMAPS